MSTNRPYAIVTSRNQMYALDTAARMLAENPNETEIRVYAYDTAPNAWGQCRLYAVDGFAGEDMCRHYSATHAETLVVRRDAAKAARRHPYPYSVEVLP